MTKYFACITSELGGTYNNFVIETKFDDDKEELIKYCEDLVNSIRRYPALADYYIYVLEE